MTTTLPATYVEAEAVARARERLREYRDAGAFRPDAGRALLRGEMKGFALAHSFNMAKLKDYARAGWTDARVALDEMAAEYVGRGEVLPPQLADHVINRLHPDLPAPRGPNKASRFLRDVCLVSAISEVHEAFGLKPTRNKLSRGTPNGRPSACAIVAMAAKAELPEDVFKGSERALESIWERLAPWVFRQEAAMMTRAGLAR